MYLPYLSDLVARPPRFGHERLLLPVFVLVLLLVLSACGRRAPIVELEMTPVAGGMVMPAEAGVDTVSAAEPDAVEATDAAVVLVGQQVTVTVPEGATLRADATDEALILQRYEVGELLDVIEPSGDFDAYPVMVDGRDWVRVRAADGLVGWLPLDALNSGE